MGHFPLRARRFFERITGAALLATPRHVLTEATMILDQVVKVGYRSGRFKGETETIGKVVMLKCRWCGWIKVFRLCRPVDHAQSTCSERSGLGSNVDQFSAIWKTGETMQARSSDSSREAASRQDLMNEQWFEIAEPYTRLNPSYLHSHFVGQGIDIRNCIIAKRS